MGSPEDIDSRKGTVKTEVSEMDLAIQQLCEKIKELATRGQDLTVSASKYSKKYTFAGSKYKAIYIPKADKTENRDEIKEQFKIVKTSSIDLIEPDTTKKRITFGYSLNFVKDAKKDKEQSVVHVQIFPEDIHQIANEKAEDLRYAPLGDLSWHLLTYTKGISSRLVKTSNGIEEVSVKPALHATLELINEMRQTLSGINPLSA